MKYQDYYKTLGVEKTADQKQIKQAYRKLAKKYHPDLNQGDEKAAEMLKEINEAYEVLSDEEKRKRYDQFGSAYDFQAGADFDPSDHGFGGRSYTYSTGDTNFSDFFNMIFGRSGAGSNSAGFGGQASSGFGGDSGFSGINIDDLFGSGKRKERRQRQDYEISLNLSLEQAFNGGEKLITLSINGSPQEVRVKWPKGISQGKKIKIKGDKYGLNGDILAKVNIVTKDTLEGNNIIKEVEFFPWDAYYGTEKSINTLSGNIKVKVPKGVKGGSKIKIKGKGFKDMKGNTGDLYVKVKIVNPENLTQEQIELYEKLKDTTKNK